MRRSKKRVFSLILALAISFTTIFGSMNYSYASEVKETTLQSSEEGIEEGTPVPSEDAGTEEGAEEGSDAGTEEGAPVSPEDAGIEEGSEEGSDAGIEEGTEEGNGQLSEEMQEEKKEKTLQPIMMKSQSPFSVQQTSGEEPDAVTSATIPVSISDALSAQEGTLVSVKGVVTMVEDSGNKNRNIFIQDGTGGICVRIDKTKTTIEVSVGDTIKGKGNSGVYNGLKQLDGSSLEGATIFKVSSEEEKINLESLVQTKTIKDITENDIAKYVIINNLTVEKVSGSNVTVTDGTGSLNIYKGVYPSGVTLKVGDKINFKGTVGTFNGLQLRNTLSNEITVTNDSETGNQESGQEGTTETTEEVKKATAKEALAGVKGSKYEVTGDVILADGYTVYIQDETGGIGAYLATYGSNIELGMKYTLTGTLEEYPKNSGILQLGTASRKKKNDAKELVAKEKGSIEEIKKEDVYSYVSLKDLTVVKKEGDNTYLQDKNGSEIILHKAKLAKSDGSEIALTVGSVISIKAAVAYYNGVQLRNTTGDEITVTKQVEATPDVDIAVKEGDKVVIYNLGSKEVLAGQDDNTSSPSIKSATAQLSEGKVEAGNGAVLFTVETNGAYYRFYNASYGYLYSKGTGSNAGYITKEDLAKETVENQKIVDWTAEKANTGFFLKSRAAVYKKTTPQYLEFYSNSYKTYSKKASDDIFIFNFYPVSNPTSDLDGDVVNNPKVVRESKEDAYLGVEYKFSYKYDVPFGVKEMTAKLGQDTLQPTEELGIFTVTVPGEKVTGEKLTFTFTGKDNKEKEINTTIEVTVLDEPMIVDVAPEAGSDLGTENKKPVIKATAINTGENPTVVMTVNNKEVKAVYKEGEISYTPETDLEDGRVSVNVTLTRKDNKVATRSWSFFVGEQTERLYFGQLHAHTAEYSDGSGTLAEALKYIEELPESANVNFVAFTDHSNYFDNNGTANPEDALYDMSKASDYAREKWSTYQNTIREFNKSASVVALPGFEMTWSGGPGHINTFNTPGIVSRNNTTLNNKTDYAGMKAYYALLSREEGQNSISQFNHPGDTFGTFGDFAFWDAVIDQRMRMVEVGNGEGAIGSGGYFPSYEYYIMALDKGWHVAPTNNQDNHKGRWGNANEARDVILTDNFTEEGIYQALRDLRAYSTEDKNLEIYYTVNGQKLGSTIKEVPENLELKVNVNDPDGSDKIQKVEVVVNSGAVAHTWTNEMDLARGDLSVNLKPEYSYYFIRVTQADGDLAVTAPVWVGEHIKLGIASVTSKTELPVTGEPLTLVTSFFNGQSTEAKVKSITYAINGSQVIGTDTQEKTISASGTLDVEFVHTFEKAKVEKLTVTAVMGLEGKEFTFTTEILLDIMESSQLSYIGIDASHYNEYVAGNYKDSMGNFSKLAIPYGLRTHNLTTSEALIEACGNAKYKAIILTAPSRRLTASHTDPRVYSEAELAALKAFNERGGVVILAGWSDHYEEPGKVSNNTNIPFEHMAETQNKVLETLGSSLRISDDATYDDTHNGGQNYRLYFNCYGDSPLVEGVVIDKDNLFDDYYTQQFSHYGGASIYAVDGSGKAVSTLPATVKPVVFGHAGTYSVDVDNDGDTNGLGADLVPKYATPAGDSRLMIMATEQLEGKGTIIVSGAAFMSNFEVKQEEVDSSAQLGYSNYRICENLVEALNPMKITPISEVHAQKEEGIKYAVEGIVTSNASGYDKDTAFFDCIYLQDATGGINCFPVAGNYKIGDKLRIVGTTSSYQGERQLAVTSVKKLGEETPVTPKEITAAQLNDQSVLGQLIKISGIITAIEKENGLIQTIMVKDSQGGVARVFIDGYITAGKEVEGATVGGSITVVGLASYDNTFKAPEGPFPRIRIKDRTDVVCTPAAGGSSNSSQGGNENSGSSQEQSQNRGSSQEQSGNSSSSQGGNNGSTQTTTNNNAATTNTQQTTTSITTQSGTTNTRPGTNRSVGRGERENRETEEKVTRIEILENFGKEHISEELQNLGYTTALAIMEHLVDVLVKIQENIQAANSRIYELALMYQENGIWVKADEDHFPADGKLRVEMEIPEGSNPEEHNYHVVHMFSRNAFGKKAGDHEVVKANVITNAAGRKSLEFYVTGLSPVVISWTEKEEVALAEEAVATEPVMESSNEEVIQETAESGNSLLPILIICAIIVIAVSAGWIVIRSRKEEN